MHPVSFIFLSFSLSLSLFTNELEKQTKTPQQKDYITYIKLILWHNLNE